MLLTLEAKSSIAIALSCANRFVLNVEYGKKHKVLF